MKRDDTWRGTRVDDKQLGVAALSPGYLIEVDAIAVIDDAA